MPETPYSQPAKPRTFKKHKSSDFQNPESNWFKITITFGGISGYCIQQAIQINDHVTQFGLGVCALTSAAIWWKVCGLNPRKADKNWIKLFFIIDEKRGRHLMNKLTVSDSLIEKVFPLKRIHKDGLMEFTGSEFAVLLRLSPRRITEEEREHHTALVKGVVDGLHDNRVFKMHAFSKINPRKAIIEYLREVANKKCSKQTAEHLNGLLNKVMKDKKPIMAYKNYAFVGLGNHDTLQSAEIARKAVMDGVILNMKRANLQPREMTDEHEIRKAYREMNSERVINV